MEEFLDRLLAAWNSHKIDDVLLFYSPDYEGEDVALAQPQRGLEGLSKMLARYWQAFLDLRFTATDLIVQGERMVVVWKAYGTHLGHIMRVPPTQRSIEATGVSILRIHDNKIFHARYVWDVAFILRCIGLLPDLAPE